MKKTFLYSVLAGICIGLGGTVFLSVENKVIGSFLFSIGLFTILAFGFNLYTGKVGYALDNGASYLGELAMIWLGNFVGTALMAILVRFTRIYEGIEPRVKSIVATKLDDNPISILLLAIGCGVCMFIAVDQYKKRQSIVKALVVILPIMTFILCSFEHCVANMFYFVLAESFNLTTLLYLLIMTFGNAVGGLLIPAVTKIAEPRMHTDE